MDSTRPRSSSNTSGQDLSADNIQIQVRINSDKTITLNVRPCHTVSNILEFLSASCTLPSDVSLLLDGKKLEGRSTVGELALSETSTLQLDPPISSPSPSPPTQSSATSTGKVETTTVTPSTPKKKSGKPRCSKDGCKTFAQPIVGDCGFCQKRFCGKHRMLESHNCAGLEDARQADKDRNALKLEAVPRAWRQEEADVAYGPPWIERPNQFIYSSTDGQM